MLKIAIAGYGNVGKAVEKLCENNSEVQLVAVFSRRKLSHKLYAKWEDAEKYKGKIDVILLTMGSYNDLTVNYKNFAGKFATVDCFDNHEEMYDYKQKVTAVAKKCTSVVGAGWDPGVLSVARVLGGLCCDNVATFWGKGISAGHTNALKSLDGVTDAVQFTIPLKSAVAQAIHGKTAQNMHKRECFVACSDADKSKVAMQIAHMKMFAKDSTTVLFVNENTVKQLKENFGHKGTVIARGNNNAFTAKIVTESNPMLTARIMICYAKVACRLQNEGKFGAFTVLDIPLKYLAQEHDL